MALQLLKLPNRTIISRRFGRATSSFSFLFSQPNLQKLPFLSSNRKVCIDGKVVNKAGTPVSDKALAQIIAEVPKAGYKLEAAIEPLFHLHSIDKLSKTCHAAMVSVMEEEATLVTLVKPQTEARRSQVGSGGVASDPLVHQEVSISSLFLSGIFQLNFGSSLLGQPREMRMKKMLNMTESVHSPELAIKE
ncbi:uncharacterized protein LOC108867420 isoform X3 [Pyrus x bretschneideri]|uniref:uncharacterized protein LOC108867420 isoform X3 n=1 Tax=Pyrus x bretschneideri TaxID=225117 RepID=UPI00202DD80E|nr:uncharacterized protein LOC108867420 isoform X3 [Pyrus x bretschneideri]